MPKNETWEDRKPRTKPAARKAKSDLEDAVSYCEEAETEPAESREQQLIYAVESCGKALRLLANGLDLSDFVHHLGQLPGLCLKGEIKRPYYCDTLPKWGAAR